jgi:hypothetical protein
MEAPVHVQRRPKDEGMTMLVVTHEMAFAREAASRVILMDGGLSWKLACLSNFSQPPAPSEGASFCNATPKDIAWRLHWCEHLGHDAAGPYWRCAAADAELKGHHLMKPAWQPTQGPVPTGFETDRLRVRPLTIHDVIKDYDAVMSSRADLVGLFPGSDWPGDNLSLEQDLIDLAWHQKEFQIGSSYAYTVITPDETRVLGCIYLFPPADVVHQADVTFWVRSDLLGSDFKACLEEDLRTWLKTSWGFERLKVCG